MQNSHHQLIIILIVIFTLLQLAVLLIFGYTPYPDSEGYIYYAEESLSNSQPYPVTTMLHKYEFLWNIGAINAIVASLAVFHSITPLLVVYALMKGLTACFFYAVSNKLFGVQTAFISLILYVIYPANYGESTSVLSELPFMCFMMAGIYLALVKKWYVLAGMMLAVGNWFRPMAIVFLLALIVYLMFRWKNSLKLIMGYIIMIAIIGTLTMNRTGLFLYQAKTGWMALMDYSSDHSPKSMKVRERNDWNVAQKDSVWKSLFIDWVKDHPTEYIGQMPTKLVNTYVSDNVNMCTFIPDKNKIDYMYEEVSMPTLIKTFPNYSAVQLLTLLNLAFYYSILFVSLFGLLFYRHQAYLLPISIIILGTMILLLAGHGEARFHIPLMPFFIMMAAQQIVWKYGENRMD